MKTAKNTLFITLLVIAMFLIATVSVCAEFQPIDGNDEVGFEKFDGTGQLIFGDYKDCSTDAFFYFLLVNQSDENVTVTLPRNVYIQRRYYYVDVDSYQYKDLADGWSAASFADAKNGEHLELNQLMQFTLPANHAYSIMGRIKNLSHVLLRDIASSDSEHSVNFDTVVFFDNKAVKTTGYLRKEGNLCNAMYALPFVGENYVNGAYLMDETNRRTCSFSFYFRVINQDTRYSSTIELPRFMIINGERWSIGCAFLDDTCNVSGFRHFAYAPEREDGVLDDRDFVFCDKDRANGDNCYEEGGLWWLRIPAGETYVVRGMVNDLCSGRDGQENPLQESLIDLEFTLADSCSNQRPVFGQIFGNRKDGLSLYNETIYVSDLANADSVSMISDNDEIDMEIDGLEGKNVSLPEETQNPDLYLLDEDNLPVCCW